MSLFDHGTMQCPTCGKEIAKSANTCPYCGHNLYGEKALKGCLSGILVWVVFVIVIAIIILLIGGL